MRCAKVALMFSLVLGLSQGLFAAVADWAEEMRTTVSGSDKSWYNFEGTWGSTVDSSSGETWKNLTNNGHIATQQNPTVGQTKWTIEYKFKFLTAVPQDQGQVIGAYFYNNGNTPSTGNVARQRNQFGYIAGDADVMFEPIYAGDNRFNYEDIGLFAVNEWQTVRINFDDTAAPAAMSMYINDALIKTVSHQSGNSLIGGQDDPVMSLGAQDSGGTLVDVEWDYLRIKTGSVVPIGEALNAVPEPSSFAMLGLAGLALLRRRS